jgi:hypothetical protein
MAALTMLLMASCKKDAQMLTVINEDGTCLRELTKHVSPRELMDSEIYPNNGKETDMEEWEQTWSLKGEDTRHPLPMTEAQYDSIQREHPGKQVADLVLKHYKREFQTIEEMSRNLPLRDYPLKVEGSLEKHFKWFYTDYEFKETFDHDTNDTLLFFPIPLNHFISADSASYWFTGQPDLSENYSGAELKDMLDEIEGKISKWINANMFVEFYDYIGDNYEKVKNPPVGKERFMALRDTLAVSPAILNLEPFDYDGKVFKQVINDYFQSEAFTSWINLRDSLDRQYSKYGNILALSTAYDLMMPGKVTDAGMGTYDGQVIHFKLTGERLIPCPYTITATSRVTNIWAFIVTFLVILLAIGSFMYKSKIKNR